ncbi:MAG: helix-turn-helix transcriptional regulator [Eubacteriales bacterium]
MSELHVERYRCEGTQYFDASAGERYSTLTFILEGQGKICTVGADLVVSAGELLYIPEGERYDVLWSGMPSIDYISFHVVAQKYDMENNNRYPAQIIRELSCEKTKNTFLDIYRMFSTENRIEKIKAVGLYYTFYAEVVPYLEAVPPIRYSDSLIEAIKYVEEKYAEDFQMEELAAHISISPSRLHHLFQKELSTTLVKYRNKCRIEHAAKDLRSANIPMEQIAERNGFHSVSYFRKTFKKYTGMTPVQYMESQQ